MQKSNYLFLVPFLLLLISSCKKDDIHESRLPPVSTGNYIITSYSGIVTDEAGLPVGGARVSVGYSYTFTNASGEFTLSNIPVDKNRCVFNVSKTGYFNQFRASLPFENSENYIRIILLKSESSSVIQSATGGTISLPDGSSVKFDPNSFVSTDGVAYNGPVTVLLYFLNQDDNNLAARIPGGDLLAVDASGNKKILITYGMMNVELYSSSGEKLQLKTGSAATLRSPVSSSLSAAPATIPTWYYDETDGYWKEEGSAVLLGNVYEYQVSHFTWWNVDYPNAIAYINGKVVDCSGNALSNAAVTANNTYMTYVNNSGEYMNYVPAGIAISLIGSLNNQVSSPENIPPLTPAAVYQVPDLATGVSQTPLLTGTITDCSGNPMSGLAVITNSQGYWASQYTGNNGVFSFNVTPGTDYTINASVNGLSNQVQLSGNIIGQCPTISIGTIPLCTNPVSGGNFSLNLITSQFGNQQYQFNANNCVVTYDGDIPVYMLSITANDTASGTSNFFQLNVSNYVPGNYSWNSQNNYLHFTMLMFGNPVEVYADISNGGGNSLTTAPAIGGNVDGSFSGAVILVSPQFSGGQITGYITGNFSVARSS